MTKKNRSSKEYHKNKIVNSIKESGPLSRKQLSTLVGLTPASISQTTAELIKEGVLYEKGVDTKSVSKAGRKQIFIDINYDYKYVIGVGIERDILEIGVTNLMGEIIYQQAYECELCLYDEKYLNMIERRLKETLDAFLKKYEKDRSDILQIGVGMVNIESDINKQNFFLENIELLKTTLEKKFKISVRVDNNVRAFAKAETKFFSNNNSFLFVKVFPGIGSAIVIDRKIVIGDNKMAGEIGHSLVREYDEENNKINLTLEELFNKEYIMKEVIDNFSEKSSPRLYEMLDGMESNLNIKIINRLLAEKDAFIVDIYRRKMKVLCYILYNLKMALDLNRIVLYFPKKDNKIFYEIIKDISYEIDKDFAQNIELSKIKSDEIFIGGIALALEKKLF